MAVAVRKSRHRVHIVLPVARVRRVSEWQCRGCGAEIGAEGQSVQGRRNKDRVQGGQYHSKSNDTYTVYEFHHMEHCEECEEYEEVDDWIPDDESTGNA